MCDKYPNLEQWTPPPPHTHTYDSSLHWFLNLCWKVNIWTVYGFGCSSVLWFWLQCVIVVFPAYAHLPLDWLQSLKRFFINVSYYILEASLTLMAWWKIVLRTGASLTYLFKEKFNQRASLEEQRWFWYLLCHNAYAAWSLLNVQIR